MDIHSHQPVFSPEINLHFPACTAQVTAALEESAELASLPLPVASPTSSASRYNEGHPQPAQQTGPERATVTGPLRTNVHGQTVVPNCGRCLFTTVSHLLNSNWIFLSRG